MKLSPVMIFILLLIFLVLSVLFCRWSMRDMDGFIGYNYTKDVAEAAIIPMYSSKNKLYKMYDSLYFDNKNGNIVEVDAAMYSNVGGVAAGNVDLTGTSITGLHISPRVGNSTMSYVINSVSSIITPSPLTDMENSYRSSVYRTLGNRPTQYTAFMLPWRDNTYVHIMDNTTQQMENVSTFAFTADTTVIPYGYTDKAAMTGITSFREDKNVKNNTMVIDPIYNTKRSMYQISEYVKYDISNANILVGAGEKALKVYARQSTSPQTLTATASDQETKNGDDQTNVANITFIPRIIYDLCGQNMILYVPNAKKTLVALICYTKDEQSNIQLGLRNVCRFTETGIDTGDSSSTPTPPTTTTPPSTGTGPDDITYANFNLDDYMLKTQVVPPVCPACPSCNYNNAGACNQCGGNGGCGTRTNTGDSLVTGGNGIRDAATATGNAETGAVNAVGNVATGAVTAAGNVAGGAVDAAGNIVNKTVDAAGNVVNKTVDTAGNVVNKTVDAAGNVVTKTVDTAGKLATGVLGAATNVATGAFGAVSNVATGALGTVGNVLGSATSALQPAQSVQGTTPGQMQQQTSVAQPSVAGATSTSDPYSYYGQLPARSNNNFMPITADFSNFGR